MSFGIPVRNGLGLGLLASTTLATQNAFGSPTLNLDFTTMTALPSTITFSRPSNATYYDSTGKLTYAPNNLVTYSNTFTNGIWTTGTLTVASGATDPLGGTSAYTITATAPSAYIQQTATGNSSTNYVYSVWVRRRTGTGQISLYTPTGGVSARSVTGTWTQFYTTGPGASFAYAGINIATSGDAVDIYAAQLEAVTYQTTPGTYNATTSAAYYGPRLDYNPATLAARGLLIEEARTNLALQSAMGTALGSWGGNASIRTLSTATAPDGTVTAINVVTTGNSGLNIAQVITTVVGQIYTSSMWLKGTLGQQIYFLADASVAGQELITFTGSWQRVTKTFTATSTSAYFGCELFNRSGGAGLPNVTFDCWGAQYELGSFATSYIPTAASSVARSADTASMTGTNFSSWYNATAGAFLVQFDTPASGTRIISAADDNTANNNIQMLTSGTDPTFLVTTSGTAQASIDAGTVAANTVYKFAGTYSANDFAACISGGTVGTDTSGTIPTVDRLRIGAGQAGNTLCGHVALLNYYPARLTDATLQSLTS